MDAKKNYENFTKCLDYIRERMNRLNGRELCIGYGARDYKHPWLDDEFQGRIFSLQINRAHSLPVKIKSLGDYYIQEFGYEADVIEKWREDYKKAGMRCPDNRHTWEELDVVPFLLDWKHIREEFDKAFSQYEGLDDFKV